MINQMDNEVIEDSSEEEEHLLKIPTHNKSKYRTPQEVLEGVSMRSKNECRNKGYVTYDYLDENESDGVSWTEESRDTKQVYPTLNWILHIHYC